MKAKFMSRKLLLVVLVFCFAALLLSCGQAIAPSWTPPPGTTWSPLVGRWSAHGDFTIVQVIVGDQIRVGHRFNDWLDSNIRIEQIGSNEFRWTIRGGNAFDTPDRFMGNAWTMTNSNGNLTVHPGTVERPDARRRYTMISGSGSWAGARMVLNVRMREAGLDNIFDYIEEGTIHAARVGDR